MRPAEARAEVEAFESALAAADYLQLSGLQAEVDTGPIFAAHAGLFERATVEEALAAAREPGADNAARFLASYLAHGYLEARVQPLSDAIDAKEATLTVPVMGEHVPFRQLGLRIADEPRRERRADLSVVRDRALDKELNPLLRERLERMHALARDLGFADYAAFSAATKGLDLQGLRRDVDTLVRRTETLYRWHMEGLLGRGASVMLATAEKHDVAYALRAPWFDDEFPRGTSVDAFEQLAKALGLSLRALPNVLLDVESRPAKSPRAFVVSVRVPQDVRLVVQPRGGYDDYRSLFHEAGHALHFGLTGADLPVEYRYLGDNSVTEAFAFVLEHVLAEEAWARSRVGAKYLEIYLWQQRVLRLFLVRRYAAKLRYELDLHTKGLDGAAEDYAKQLDRVLVFRNPPEHFLSDVDDAFYCANYLRAWALESILRGQLRERFGEDWWRRPAAGDWLRGLWSHGQAWTAEELAQHVGARLSLQPLQDELIAELRVEPRDYHGLPKF